MKHLVFAAALLLTAGAAHDARADSKSWTAVKGLLPDNVNVIAGANLATLRGTAIYQTVVPRLIAKEPDAQRVFDLAKSTCGLDLHAALVDATIAMGDDERGVVVVTLDKSLDQRKLVDCFGKLVTAQMTTQLAPPPTIAEAQPPATGGLRAGAKRPATRPAPAAKPATPKIVAKTTGKITEYGIAGEPKKLYIAWLAADVLAISTDPDDKALLDRMIGGKGTQGAMTKLVGKASPGSAIWLATTKPTPVPTGGTMKAGFGTVDATRGNVALDMHMVMTTAKDAKKFVDDAVQLLTVARSQIPPQFAGLVDALKVSAAGDDASMKLVAAERDLLGLITFAFANL